MGRAAGVKVILAAALALAALLAGCGGPAGEEEDKDASTPPPKRDADGRDTGTRKRPLTADVPLIARRVAALRDLSFRRVPRPRMVTQAQARREGVAESDRAYPTRARRADEEVLKLLGLLPPRADVRKIFGTVFGEQVAGYYDTRRERLSVVAGAGGGRGGEIVLAHELTHALEDQRFELKDPPPGTNDASTAREALVEGTATSLMLDYARAHIGTGRALQEAFGALGDSGPETKLPPYVQASLEFPYLGGLRWVQALRARAGGGWKLVNEALRRRPPVSTEQVLHPEKWLREEAPRRVALRARGPLRAGGFTRVAGGELGEWDSRELLRQALPDAAADDAAQGWGGGRYELWQRPRPHEPCPAPCRRRDALVLAWKWDSTRDARDFARALAAWLPLHLKARARGGGSWTVGEGAAHLEERRRATALVFAPFAPQAARLARRAAGS